MRGEGEKKSAVARATTPQQSRVADKSAAGGKRRERLSTAFSGIIIRESHTEKGNWKVK